MAKKRKKSVIDKLARKRGRRAAESRLKRKKPPRSGKKPSRMTDEERENAEKALLKSPHLLSLPQFEGLHLNSEGLTGFLEEVKKDGLEDPQEFVSRGLRKLADADLLENVKLGLTHLIQAYGKESPELALSASLVHTLMDSGANLAHIPFFTVLFVRVLKDHPMADDPAIWKLLSAFLPSKLVKPEEEAEPPQEKGAFERSEDFPHIVVPRGYSQGDR